jgi:hypothetical protein
LDPPLDTILGERQGDAGRFGHQRRVAV